MASQTATGAGETHGPGMTTYIAPRAVHRPSPSCPDTASITLTAGPPAGRMSPPASPALPMPSPRGRPSVVGTPYVAGKLGCTTVWVSELARKGDIPKACVVPGTGIGKPWKFFRVKIDGWIAER